MRGIGGIFFDDLSLPGEEGFDRTLAFVREGAATILAAYLPWCAAAAPLPTASANAAGNSTGAGATSSSTWCSTRGTPLRPANRWQHRGHSDVAAAAGPLGVQYAPEPGSPEAELARFLTPRDWAA
jgi:coproporphyrinogen III oxidase